MTEAPPTLTEDDLKTKKTIYVKNSEFPKDFTEEQLKELFKECGTVVMTTLLRKPATKELRGTGFVEFETHEAAAKAVKEYNNKLVGNGRLGVVFSTSSGPKEAKPQKVVEEGPCLFVRALNFKVRNKQLRKEFEPFGKITNCRVNKKGYAFVEYETVDEAKKAKDEMNGKEIEGKAVEIFFAEKREKKEKPKKKEKKAAEATPEKKTKRKRNKRRGKGKKTEEPAEAKQEEKETEAKTKKAPPKGRRRIFLKCIVEEGETKKTDGVTNEDVQGFLAQFGEVTKCKVIQRDAGTFVYVNFAQAEDAEKAKQAQEGEIKGSKFLIDYTRLNRRPRRKGKGGGASSSGATQV